MDTKMLNRYLDPKVDLTFKRLFGSKAHKKIPISFLNAVFNLKGDDTIVDLSFLSPHQPPEIAARKESIVDVLVRDQKDSEYIIEMQVAKFEGFEERAQFYAAKTYCSHFQKGKEYVNLKKVIFLAITDYIVFPEKKSYKSDHITLDKKTYEHDLKNFWFTFVELPKFKKTIDELETIEDKWYYFLKHAEESNEIMSILASDPEIKEAYEVLDRFHWTENDIQVYEKMLMNISDEKAKLSAAKKEGLVEGKREGIQEGHKKGIQEGIQKGKKEGHKEGHKEGEKKRALHIARTMLKESFSIDQISKLTGLNIEDLESLQDEQKS